MNEINNTNTSKLILIPIRQSNNIVSDEVLNTINKFIEYSLKNGPEFEENVKIHEINNNKFDFLRSGISNLYYHWKLYIKQQQLTTIQINECITEYGVYISTCIPGHLELLDIDKYNLIQTSLYSI
mgnify:FL=1